MVQGRWNLNECEVVVCFVVVLGECRRGDEFGVNGRRNRDLRFECYWDFEEERGFGGAMMVMFVRRTRCGVRK